MKTVSGKVVNTAPMSLSRAAKVISNFASFDNGASDVVSIYLKRASEAFDDLVQFHKDLKAPNTQSTRKPKNHRSTEDDSFYSSSVKLEPTKIEEEDGVDEKKKKRKQLRKEKLDMVDVKLERYDGVDDAKIENSIKKERDLEEEEEVVVKKKKRKSSEEGVDDSAEQSMKKKNKRIKIEIE